jgi:ABC-type branched-subunit amino acid transport system substrate-binding protein
VPQAGVAPPLAAGAPQAIAPAAVPPPPALVGAQTRVGLLLPLSGANAKLGEAMLNAAQMALFDVAGNDFVLLPRDTQGTPEGAAQAASAVLAQGAQLILGPLLAAEVAAVKPIAHQANVSMVAFSTNEQLAGDGTYLLGFPPRQSVDRIVAYAHQQGVARFAALAPQTPYGELVVDELRTAANADGASVTHVELYDPGTKDLRPTVRRLAAFAGQAPAEAPGQPAAAGGGAQLALNQPGGGGFDAVLIPESGARLKEVASLLPYFDVDPAKIHVLGTGIWDEPGLGSEPALVGGWFAAPAPSGQAAFAKRFQQLFKAAPPRLASLGYDAVALAAVLAKKAGPAGFTAAALTDPSGFAGVDGIFRFRADGRADRGLAVLEVERAGFKVVSPAPDTFERPAS